jgi:hypothetical protein
MQSSRVQGTQGESLTPGIPRLIAWLHAVLKRGRVPMLPETTREMDQNLQIVKQNPHCFCVQEIAVLPLGHQFKLLLQPQEQGTCGVW